MSSLNLTKAKMLFAEVRGPEDEDACRDLLDGIESVANIRKSPSYVASFNTHLQNSWSHIAKVNHLVAERSDANSRLSLVKVIFIFIINADPEYVAKIFGPEFEKILTEKRKTGEKLTATITKSGEELRIWFGEYDKVTPRHVKSTENEQALMFGFYHHKAEVNNLATFLEDLNFIKVKRY